MAFPSNLFVSGHNNPVQFQLLGQAAETLNVTGSSWDEEINAIDVTHSGSGGIQALLANILRGNGTVNADYDLLVRSPYFFPIPQIRPGVSGLFAFYVLGPVGAAGNRFFTIPCMIIKVHWETQVAGKVSYSFDVRLSSIVGNYLYPAA